MEVEALQQRSVGVGDLLDAVEALRPWRAGKPGMDGRDHAGVGGHRLDESRHRQRAAAAVQHEHGGAASAVVEGEGEVVDEGFLAHGGRRGGHRAILYISMLI